MHIVTGTRGLIGRALQENLRSAGYQVLCLDRESIDWDRLHDTRIQWIWHMGAISETNAADWGELMELNVSSTQNWIRFAEMKKCGITYASSASLYGPWVNSPEWGPVQPQHLYGISKLAVDNWVGQNRFTVPVQGMRFFNVYGLHEGHKAQPSPLRRFMEQAQTQRRITVWNHHGRLGSRDFVSVDDCVSAMMSLSQRGASGIFNIGTGTTLTFMDVAQLMQRHLGIPNCQIMSVPMPDEMVEKYQWDSLANLDRLRAFLPTWNPQTMEQWLDHNWDQLYNIVREDLQQ